jgi:ubiquinone/menaquinone biosynthesis C-methylase UbiE/uncharacterized protein YbaR (Trm112 family)
MASFLQGIIADPVSGTSLELVDNEYFINPANGNKYPVNMGVPNFLPPEFTPQAEIEPVGGNKHSGFNYREHYQKDAELVDYFEEDKALVTRNERKRNRQAIIASVPGDAETILDIGCGGAWVAAAFLPQGRNVISMDISSLNPIRAKEKYPQQNHEAIIADALTLPFKDSSLDCIIASELIEHMTEPDNFIAGLIAKLKPGGSMILMTPYNEDIRYHLCVHCNLPTPQNGHLHSFTESKILALIPGDTAMGKATAFCNKYLLKLRVYNLLAFLPFPIWKIIDKLANMLARKPLSLITVAIKK